jgi:hypothetical protein
MFFTAAGSGRLKGNLRKASLSNPVAATTLEEYAALFRASRSNQARGEASTAYLANATCATRIRDLIPDVKLVAILRNPLDRAFSNYLMYWGNGMEERTFDQCVQDELEGRYEGIPQGRWYLKLGLYAAAIQRFQEVFGRDALLVASYDDFLRDAAGVYRRVLEHIAVDPSFVPDMTKRFNRAEDHIRGKDRPRMSTQATSWLGEYFRADINQLASLVPFDPTMWLLPEADAPSANPGSTRTSE